MDEGGSVQCWRFRRRIIDTVNALLRCIRRNNETKPRAAFTTSFCGQLLPDRPMHCLRQPSSLFGQVPEAKFSGGAEGCWGYGCCDSCGLAEVVAFGAAASSYAKGQVWHKAMELLARRLDNSPYVARDPLG